MRWDAAAEERWAAFYNTVVDDVTGMVGALTARAEAHVLRFALSGLSTLLHRFPMGAGNRCQAAVRCAMSAA
jgi:hypothetical protein